MDPGSSAIFTRECTTAASASSRDPSSVAYSSASSPSCALWQGYRTILWHDIAALRTTCGASLGWARQGCWGSLHLLR